MTKKRFEEHAVRTMDQRDMLLFWLQLGSALIGLAAATLWFMSAAKKTPPATLDGGAQMQSFLNGANRLNRFAAVLTGLLALSSAASTIITLQVLPARGGLNTRQTTAQNPTSSRLTFDCAGDDAPLNAEGMTIDELQLDPATKQIGIKGHTTNNPMEIRNGHYTDNAEDSLGAPCMSFVQTTDVQVAFGTSCDVVGGKTILNYRFPYWTLNRYNQKFLYFVGHQLKETEQCFKRDERKL